MIRAIAAVIVGYLAMVVVTFISFTVTYKLVGADGAFAAGTYGPSGLWMVMSLVVGSVAAVVGVWCAG